MTHKREVTKAFSPSVQETWRALEAAVDAAAAPYVRSTACLCPPDTAYAIPAASDELDRAMKAIKGEVHAQIFQSFDGALCMRLSWLDHNPR